MDGALPCRGDLLTESAARSKWVLKEATILSARRALDDSFSSTSAPPFPSRPRVADLVLARRVRPQVLAICERVLRETPPQSPEDRYWLLATMAECAFGLEESERGVAYQAQADQQAPSDWMRESTRDQLGRWQRSSATPRYVF